MMKIEFPVYLKVYDQFFKINSLDEVIIIRPHSKVIHKNGAYYITSAVLGDLNEGLNHVKKVSKIDFAEVARKTCETIGKQINDV